MPIKLLPVLMALAIWAAAPALAFDSRRPAQDAPGGADNPIYLQRGSQPQCYRGLNGRGKVIPWAKNRQQCRNQTNGQSWGHSGHFENIYRDTFPR